ncbi:MAG: indole-3-glycerol-phosphate synthase, partial [Phycisphaerales bacterium]
MSVLSIILDHKRTEVEARKKRMVVEAMTRPTLPGLDFMAALRRSGISVIAEIKRKSPSRGSISERANVADIAASYRRGGASALSVLTDHRFFGAAADDLAIAKRVASLPVLRKDFIIDPYQIHESIHLGADAVLLIVAALTDGRLQDLTGLAREVGLQVLVEVHSENELERALVGGATIIGVNSRNLATLA